jgi:hypothetical protein
LNSLLAFSTLRYQNEPARLLEAPLGAPPKISSHLYASSNDAFVIPIIFAVNLTRSDLAFAQFGR